MVEYQKTWEWIATRISPEVLHIAKAVELHHREQMRDSLNWLCQHLSFDDINPSQSDRDWVVYHMAYEMVSSEARHTLQALALVQCGIWKEIPEEHLKGFALHGDLLEGTWSRLEEIGLIAKIEHRYVITSEVVLNYAKNIGCFAWGIETQAEPKVSAKSESSPQTKLIISNKTEKHCYKFDEGCFLCRTGLEGLRYRLTLEEVIVYQAKLSGVGELSDHQKDIFICETHIEDCKKDPKIEVVMEIKNGS